MFAPSAAQLPELLLIRVAGRRTLRGDGFITRPGLLIALLAASILETSCGGAATDTTHCKRVLERQAEYGLVYPGAQVREHFANEGSSDPMGFSNSQPPKVVIALVTTDAPEIVAAWYATKMQDLGWTVHQPLIRRPEGAFELAWSRAGSLSYVTVVPDEIARMPNGHPGENLVRFIYQVNDTQALKGCGGR